MRGVVISEQGDVHQAAFDSVSDMQRALGGCVEVYHPQAHCPAMRVTVFVNGEAWQRGLAPNHFAHTLLWRVFGALPLQPIAGPVVIVGKDERSLCVRDLRKILALRHALA